MRNALIAKIHIAKKTLGLDDETYRLVLEQAVKKKSTKQCSELQLIKVLNVLKEKDGLICRRFMRFGRCYKKTEQSGIKACRLWINIANV